MKEYIEREATLKVLQQPYDKVREMLAIPAADVEEVRHGRWIRCKTILDIFKCSCCCDKFFDSEKYKYCPNCGAKMDKEVE